MIELEIHGHKVKLLEGKWRGAPCHLVNDLNRFERGQRLIYEGFYDPDSDMTSARRVQNKFGGNKLRDLRGRSSESRSKGAVY